MITFPVSGVQTEWWILVLVAFGISSLTSLGGISGAFLLLPFQVSVLGFTGPAVSSTNLFFNIVATPAGVIGIMREKRMVWPLAAVLGIGTVSGGVLGAWFRIRFLLDPRWFKLFVAVVLAYIGVRLLLSILQRTKPRHAAPDAGFRVSNPGVNLRRIRFTFHGVDYSISTLSVYLLSATVGMVGTAYGIGGGAIIAPFLISVFELPVYAVAGPAFLSTFISSLGGLLTYTLFDRLGLSAGVPLQPDWLLGFILGIGGAAGVFLGTQLQRFVPARWIKLLIFTVIGFVAMKYVLEFVRG